MSGQLSQWRYKLTVVDAGRGAPRSKSEGAAFLAIRERCGLSRRDVAIGWGIEAATIRAIESGSLSFPTRHDLQAAISQLWLWASERREP